MHCNGKKLASNSEGTVKSTVSNSNFTTVFVHRDLEAGEVGILDTI